MWSLGPASSKPGGSWPSLICLARFSASTSITTRSLSETAVMPFAPLARTISLTARREVLGEVPGQVAGRLRGLVEELVVGPGVADWPWLEGVLRVEGA